MKILQLFILLFLINFSVKSQERLNENLTINTIFNKSEIQDLETILDFFNEQICSSKSLTKEK